MHSIPLVHTYVAHYSGNALIGTPLGQKKVSWLVEVSWFQGLKVHKRVFVTAKGVLFLGSSLSQLHVGAFIEYVFMYTALSRDRCLAPPDMFFCYVMYKPWPRSVYVRYTPIRHGTYILCWMLMRCIRMSPIRGSQFFFEKWLFRASCVVLLCLSVVLLLLPCLSQHLLEWLFMQHINLLLPSQHNICTYIY